VRSLWKGVLSFGLVSIPVRLYAATESRDVHLRYLHLPCAAPVRYRKVCTACGREVEEEELGMGYEAQPGVFVPIAREELKALDPGPDHAIEMERFVPVGSVDPVFLAKAYYLEPQPGAQRAYQLLHRALSEEERAAVVRLSLRQRSRWALVRPGDAGVLHLDTLLDADEVRPATAIQVGPPAQVRDAEVDLARHLVRTLAAEFRPQDNPDRYRKALEELIARKAQTQALRPAAAPEAARVVDLMEALRASLRAVGEEGKDTASARRAGKGKGRAAREVAASPPRSGAKAGGIRSR
jgi:DNA end-binding protein Ku